MAKKSTLPKTTGVISFRGGEAEQLALRDISERLNVSESEAARSVIRACAGTGLMLEPQDRKQFTHMAEGLRQTGININQAVRAMNAGRVPDDAKLRSDLGDLAAGMTAIHNCLLAFARKREVKAIGDCARLKRKTMFNPFDLIRDHSMEDEHCLATCSALGKMFDQSASKFLGGSDIQEETPSLVKSSKSIFLDAQLNENFKCHEEVWTKAKAGGGSPKLTKGLSGGYSSRVGSVSEMPFINTPQRMEMIAQGHQAAVVKIVSYGAGRGSAGALINYNTREGKEALEKENGEFVLTHDDHKKLIDEWESYFDKREPSKDVVTLHVKFARHLEHDERGAFQNAIEEELSDQRMVYGWVEDHGFNTVSEFYAVIAVAKKIKAKPKSKSSGVAPVDPAGKTTNRPTRMKTTDAWRDAFQQKVSQRGKGRWDETDATYSFSKSGHGTDGVEVHMKNVLERTGHLSGPKDDLFQINNNRKGRTIARIAKSWRRDIRSYGGRDIMHLVVSSKQGTDETQFTNAARDFLGDVFANHKYAFALHGPKDTAIDKRTKETKATEHVHIHAMIVMRGYDQKKLNPNINDLHLWRQRMAHHARGYGINMVATHRAETVNAPSFTKSDHTMAKRCEQLIARGKTPDEDLQNALDKVQAKNENRPTLFSTRKSIRDADAGRYALLKMPKKANHPKQLENIAQLKDRYDQTDLSNKLDVLRSSQQLNNAQMRKEVEEKHDLNTENETEPSREARKLPDDILTLNAFVGELAKIDFSKLDEKFKNDFARKINQLAVKYRDNEPIRSFVVQKHKEAVSMIETAQRQEKQIGSEDQASPQFTAQTPNKTEQPENTPAPNDRSPNSRGRKR